MFVSVCLFPLSFLHIPFSLGLYYSDIFRRNICYSPSDPTCPEAIPVKCIPPARSEGASAESDDITTTEPVVAEAVIAAAAPALASESTNGSAPFSIGDDICQTLCLLTNTCAFDPFAHGTYCKSYNSPAVCFGFYFRVFPFRVCFAPNDPTCPETRPVPCGFNLNQLVLDPPTDAVSP